MLVVRKATALSRTSSLLCSKVFKFWSYTTVINFHSTQRSLLGLAPCPAQVTKATVELSEQPIKVTHVYTPKRLVHNTWFCEPFTDSVQTSPWKLKCEMQTPLSLKQAHSAKNALFCELLASTGQNAISFAFSCQRHKLDPRGRSQVERLGPQPNFLLGIKRFIL